MTNYYENLPNSLINEIEDFLQFKPEDIKKIIENPPKRYKNILDSWSESQLIERDDKGRYSFYWRTRPQEEINSFNIDTRQIQINLIKFFIEFDVKSVSRNGLGIRKAKKHGFKIPGRGYFNLKDFIRSCDHVREYTTRDKKHIILSSPYIDDDHTREEHFKYGFQKYRLPLYHKSAYTYYLILE